MRRGREREQRERAESGRRAEDVDGDAAGVHDLDERQHDRPDADDAEDERREERDPAQVGPGLVDDGRPELERPVGELGDREQRTGDERSLRVERVGFEAEDRDVLGAEERDRHGNGHREAQNEARREHRRAPRR